MAPTTSFVLRSEGNESSSNPPRDALIGFAISRGTGGCGVGILSSHPEQSDYVRSIVTRLIHQWSVGEYT